MSNIVTVTDFRNNVADVLNRVKYRNETIYLVRGKTLVAKISKVDDYLSAKVPVSPRLRGASNPLGFFPKLRAAGKMELYGLKEWGGKMRKQMVKRVLDSATFLQFKFKRWVKFCFTFQKNWG